MKKFTIIITIFIFYFSLVKAESANSSIINAGTFFSYPKTISYTNKSKSNSLQAVNNSNDVKCISFNNLVLNNFLINSGSEINIKDFPITPLNTGTIILQHQTPIVDGNTEIWIKSKKGEYKSAPINIQSYYGKIEGQENSKVYLTVAENLLYCIIQPETGEKYFISPVMGESATINSHLLVSEDILLAKNVSMPISCYTLDNSLPGGEILNNIKNKNQVLSNTLLQLNLALEASSDYCAIFAYDSLKVLSQMIAVMTCVSKIYETELNTLIYIPYIYIWMDSTSDPYTGKTDVSTKLYAMPKAWKNRTNVVRSLSCLFAALPTSQGIFTAGISMGINTLCSKNNGYCVFGMYGNNNLPTMNYTWDVNVSAHEVGHGCGGIHTHSCWWDPPIDTCITENLPYSGSDGCITGTPIPRPGTIMSYCHLTNSTRSVQYTFGERVIPVIRSCLEKAACIAEVPNATISLLNPLIDKMYKAGTVVPIKWVSTKVNTITIKYTIDGGKTWTDIPSATAIPASNLSFNWLLPNVQSDKVLLLIRDAYNMTVADTSLKPFSIHSPLLQMTSNITGYKFGQKEDINLTWQSIFADTINIEFSSDAGLTWISLANKITGNYYLTNAPEVISQNCIIRLKNAGTDNLTSQSGIFSIGKSTATITKPTADEKLCAGEDYYIQWQSDYLNSIYFEYSNDNMVTWKKVNLASIDATTGQFKWHIPNLNSDNVYLRLYSKADKTNILDVTPLPFSIRICPTGVSDNEGIVEQGIKILDVVPNPFNNNAIIKVQNNSSSNRDIQMTIVNSAGQILQTIGNYQLSGNATSEINLKTTGLSQGSYFILLKSGENHTSYPIRIIR